MVNRLLKHASTFAAALALAMPFVAKAAVDYTGTDYAPWSYSAGCVVWRAASGQLFHGSTVADVAADGTIGATYDLNTSGHPWQVFASNQSAYTSPGTTLVFDEAGYNASPDAQFAPLSFGGMWVNALQADGTPYCITDNKTDNTDRKVELGATGASTYFKFDKSFTFDRNSATRVIGTATVDIANGATFTINARAGKGALVEAGNTLVLTGEGTLAVVAGLSVSGTLDLSAATRPTIDGDVTLVGEPTIVLPAGTELPFTVCSGTLSASAPVLVKIGDGEAEAKSLTVSGGAVTAAGEPVYVFTENYPTVVPAGKTYTFVGGDSAEDVKSFGALAVWGTLKTQGHGSISSYNSNASSVLDIETGSLTFDPGNYYANGTITVESGATLVNAITDAVAYSGTFTANVYGTLTMGATRWSLGSNNTLNFYEGCTVTGSGQASNGTFDWIENATGTLNVHGTVNLAAPIKIRGSATVNVDVDAGANAGLTLADTIGSGTIVKKGAGLINFTTNPPYAITVEDGAFTFAVDATPTITYSAKPGTGTSMSMWYATQSTWKGTVVLGVLSAPASLPLGTYGNENSKIVMKGTTGSCYLSAGTIASELVIDTEGDDKVEFNNGSSGQIVNFTKVSGSGTLKLVAWAGCSSATYNITTFDGFTGTLAVENGITRGGGGTFTIGIGNIVTTGSTDPGARVLPIVNTEVASVTGTVVYNIDNAQVNGEAKDLVVKSDGIYIKGKTATITYPGSEPVDSFDPLTSILETLYTGYTAEKAGTVVTVVDGSDESVGDAFPAIYDYDSANHTYTLKTMVAKIGDYNYFPTLAGAVAQAKDLGGTVTLIADVTVDESITVASDNTVTLDLNGNDITGPAGDYVLVNEGSLTITGSGAVTGAGIVSNATSAASASISGGAYTATGDLFGNVEGGTISVSGGSYNKTVADEYLADGYEVKANGDGTYGVREDKGWIYENADYPGYTGTWLKDLVYDDVTGKARIEDGNTYTATTPSAGQMVTIDMGLSFDAINEDDDDYADAKAAIRLGAGATDGTFVFQLYTSDGNGSKWVDVTASGVEATTGTVFDFEFVLDMTNLNYTASVNGQALVASGDETTFAFAGASASDTVQSIQFVGAGDVTSIVGAYEDITGFVPDKLYGSVILTQAQADWLNAQNNYAALDAKLATMTQAAVDAAYLLNLNVVDANYDGTYAFTVTNIAFDKDASDNEVVVVTVGLTRAGALDGGINGTLKLKGTSALGTDFDEIDSVTFSDEDFSAGDTTTCTFLKGDAPAKFYQAVIE